MSVYAISFPSCPYGDLDRTLFELRRVLKQGGVLRLELPDMDRAINAYRAGDVDYFLISDDEVQNIAGKMIVQLLWHGQSKSLFTTEFAAELLARNGFQAIHPCLFRETSSGISGITELDDRPRESLLIEATK